MTRLIAKLLAVALIVHAKHVVRQNDGSEKIGWSGCSAVYVAPGRALSAAHCFDAGDIGIWVEGVDKKPYVAYVERLDRTLDLALLYVENDDQNEFVKIGRDPMTGNKVEIVANPLDIGLLYSEGIVAGQVYADELSHILLLTSAMIAHGSSGGGVFDRKGRLVGIAEVILPSSGGLEGAVGTEDIRRFLRGD